MPAGLLHVRGGTVLDEVGPGGAQQPAALPRHRRRVVDVVQHGPFEHEVRAGTGEPGGRGLAVGEDQVGAPTGAFPGRGEHLLAEVDPGHGGGAQVEPGMAVGATAAAGNLPEATCGQRVQTLAEKVAGLRDRRAELTVTLDAADQEGPTEAELNVLRSKIRDVIADGDTGAQKQLLYSLVHAVQASQRRSDIQPIFKIPNSLTPLDPKVRKLT